MSVRGWLNKYMLAIASALILGGFYVYVTSDHLSDLNFDRTAAGVGVGTFGTVICLCLLFEVATPNVDLGALQDEKSTLIGGLIFTVFLGVVWVAQLFNGMPAAPPIARAQPQAWLYHDWGDQGDCSTPLILRRGRDDTEVIFLTGPDRFTLRIVEKPSGDTVATDEGTFTLQPDGSMSYDQMENKKFTRCDR
jgi:hypothetical protein